MADGDSDRNCAAHPSTRDEYIAVAIHFVNDLLIGIVQFRVAQASSTRIPSKADHAEGDRSETFEILMGIHPSGKLLGERDVVAEDLADPLRAIRAQNHPEFQRAKTAAQLNAGVHQIVNLAWRRAQVV